VEGVTEEQALPQGKRHDAMVGGGFRFPR
jgi:hypothetical protein